MELKLIDGLLLNEDGVLINEGNKDAVHLRQGDMDGACGPYCVAMGLLVLGKIRRDELLSHEKIDGRTSLGKLRSSIHELGTLALAGSSASDLCGILKAHNWASGEPITGTGKSLIPQVIDALNTNHPVILDVRSKKNEGLNHWTLAIGFSEDHLFLLDPGYELRSCNFWNANVTTCPTNNRYGYRYANPWVSCDVEISTMIEVQ